MPIQLAELLDDGDIPTSLLLGRLVLFTITDQPTPRSVLEAAFLQHNLNPTMLPPETKPVDAFKKATSEAKEKFPLPDGTTAHFLCRDVASTPEYVKRQITREIKDSRAKRLSYDKAIDCVFYRATPSATPGDGKGRERLAITVDTGLPAAEHDLIKQVGQDILNRYAVYYNNLDGNRLRAVVRDYLKHLNAIEIKGGVYFVHVARDNELANLQALVNNLGGGCQMNTIPMVDVAREREMVTAAFEREAAQALQDLTRDIKEIRSTRKTVSPSAYAKVQDRYNEVVAKANEHLVTLQISQDITGAEAEVALEELGLLREDMLR